MALRLVTADSQYLRRTTSLLDHNAAYTIAAWVVFEDDSANQGIWQHGRAEDDYDNNDTVHFKTGDSVLRIYAANAGAFDQALGTTVLSVGTWYHVALVRTTASDMDLYVNGVLDASVSIDTAGRGSSLFWSVGKFEAGNFASLRTWGMKAWQRALTAAELTREMRTASPSSSKNLHGWWPFLVANRESDYSGNGRTWTANNSPTNGEAPGIAFGVQEPIVIQPADASADVTVVPGTASLTIATFAPVLQTTVITGDASLSIATFSPVLRQDVVVPTASLTLTTFEPTIDISSGDVTVTPETSDLAITTYAPVIDISSGDVTAIPDTATLTVSMFASVLRHDVGVPTTNLTTTRYQPSLGTTVTPPPIELGITSYAPDVSSGSSSDVTVTPTTAELVLMTFAPTGVGVVRLTATEKHVLQKDFLNLVESPSEGAVEIEVVMNSDGGLRFYYVP